MTCVIPAGGPGSRISEETIAPKPMIVDTGVNAQTERTFLDTV